MQGSPASMENVHMDISVLPLVHTKEPIGSTIDPKLLAFEKKFKFNWRINELSKPKPPASKKFTPKPVEILRFKAKPPLKISDEIKFYADHMSKPKLKTLYENRRLYGINRKMKHRFDKTIFKTWNSIYNYYKKLIRDRQERLNRKQDKQKDKKASLNKEFYMQLAKPKTLFKPEPIQKTSKIFSNFNHLDELASPKKVNIEPPKSLDVNPAALTYEATETILRLAKVPDRLMNLPEPLEPGAVKRGALKYQATPRMGELAQPKQRIDKMKEELIADPFLISRNALKYKATPRILELAKPVER
ncbi:unnamed protein product [Ceutorhynchus assimilis]|uniref:Uncharacterized protein n=1 Tax=Ceutorhynchus assimilis TaxID=467358 RepID=A0A9N9QQ62_9CUCU|nr:unnamed protein product [Ceutorhynchus assimilis]